jgi:uncharacterized repeat protein (TIGR03803 family)
MRLAALLTFIFVSAGAALDFEELYTFQTTEVYLNSKLALGDEDFYGVTFFGGDENSGTVFKVTPAGELTVLLSFASTNGSYPDAGLVRGLDGHFYGTTGGGGAHDNGTIFKMTQSGNLTTLAEFDGANGKWPRGELVQGNDGNFYGTTYYGGDQDGGTVFKMTPAGVLTLLVSFTGSNGLHPEAGLIQGTDGNFYGTTFEGGTNDIGTAFKMTPEGTLTTLVSFEDSPGGYYPHAGLVQGSDGHFYGTTYAGGSGYGTVFRMTSSGDFATVASFSGENGAHPFADLLEGNDGNFYGTTLAGGTSDIGGGTVFKMSPAGELTALVSFNGTNGMFPHAGLVRGSDGNLYGTTSGGIGGENNIGTIYRLVPSSPFPLLSIGKSGGDIVLSWPVSASSFNLEENSNLSFTNGWTAIFPTRNTNGETISVMINTPVQNKFYRLSQ